jgi:hypothetical protein
MTGRSRADDVPGRHARQPDGELLDGDGILSALARIALIIAMAFGSARDPY